MKKSHFIKIATMPLRAAGLIAPLSLSPLSAADAGGVSIHGSVSVTGSYSDTYNYLGDTRDHLDANIVEAIINGTHRFENGLRAGAQLYAYKLGDYNDVVVDWANVDCSFKPWFGVRLGRNKLPIGLYNDSQDLDAVRTFASLPLTSYPKSYRPITSSFDGLCFYGNVGLEKAGSFDYQVFGGVKDDIDGDTPFVLARSNLGKYSGWDIKRGIMGGALIWNAPLEGLRLGYSYAVSPKNYMEGPINKSWYVYGDYARMIGLVGGPSVWDAYLAGTPTTLQTKVSFSALSAEYTLNKWLFAAEYKIQDNTPVTLAFPAAGISTTTRSAYEEYYGMVTYQATRQVGLGLYYSYENLAYRGSGSAGNPFNYTRDWAAALSYAPADAWIFKIEAHALCGRSLVFSAAGDDNFSSGNKNRWNYFVVKSTFSF